MRIVVCLKQIIDPELPTSQFRIDAGAKRQQSDSHPLVISPYDENALELALKLKEQTGGHVAVVSVGQSAAVSALRKGLAMGADEAALISDPALDGSDAFGVATALAHGIRKLGQADVVLCGCESGDWADRIVGPILAETLGIPCVTYVSRVQKDNGAFHAHRVVEEGYEIWQLTPPVLLTVLSDETNTPRYPKVKDIMAASRRSIPTWSQADLDLGESGVGPAAARVEIHELSLPTRESRCEVLEGEPPEQVSTLVARLRERKVI